MPAFSLHWFRAKQRTVARLALAVFCLTWLQLAAMPCVMAAGATAISSPAGTVAMPEGMVMGAGDHCPYCPVDSTSTGSSGAQELCTFPHDPQVDSRAAFASTLLAPPPALVLFVAADRGEVVAQTALAVGPPPPAGTSLAVSFCRFLK
jgi:hypothetical protein